METINTKQLRTLCMHLRHQNHLLHQLFNRFNINSLLDLPSNKVDDFIIEIGLLTDKEYDGN